MDRAIHLELEFDGNNRGCSIVASSTPPVEEMITSGDQGQMVDFFDPDALAQQVDHLLHNQEQRQKLGERARKRIMESVATQKHPKQQVQLVNQVMRG